MSVSERLLIILLSFVVAFFETIGVLGAGKYWVDETKLFSVVLIIVGFCLASLVYVLMRKYVSDLALAQSIFIGSSAVLAIFFELSVSRPKVSVIFGLIFITIGAIIINKSF